MINFNNLLIIKPLCMKKKKSFRSYDDEYIDRNPRKMTKKNPRNLKREIFEEIEENEDIEEMFRDYESGEYYDDEDDE